MKRSQCLNDLLKWIIFEEHKMNGEVCIPEEKRDEVNRLVQDFIYKLGIRKTKTLELAEKEVMVVSVPKPNEKGIIEFDYSIFERYKRESSYYDTNTCQLYVNNDGYREFQLAMLVIMTLQENYSSTPCFLMEGDKLLFIDPYVALVNTVFGIKLSLPKRNQNFTVAAKTPIELYRAFLRENEDEFIEFWNEKDLMFSTDMEHRFVLWKKQYDEIENTTVEEMNIEAYLAEVLSDLESVFHGRYVDEKLVEEFILNKNNVSYRKALFLFRKIMNSWTDMFPELTGKQPKRRRRKQGTTDLAKIELGAYSSLLINIEKREKILGF